MEAGPPDNVSQRRPRRGPHIEHRVARSKATSLCSVAKGRKPSIEEAIGQSAVTFSSYQFLTSALGDFRDHVEKSRRHSAEFSAPWWEIPQALLGASLRTAEMHLIWELFAVFPLASFLLNRGERLVLHVSVFSIMLTLAIGSAAAQNVV